jgi:hypothetical protein
MFWHQFENVGEHNCWTCLEKSTYLIIALQGCATDVEHGVPIGTTCEETLEALEDCSIPQSVKNENQGVGES